MRVVPTKCYECGFFDKVVVLECELCPDSMECRNCKKIINIKAAIKKAEQDWG